MLATDRHLLAPCREVTTDVLVGHCEAGREESWEQMQLVLLDRPLEKAGFALGGAFFRAQPRERWAARLDYEHSLAKERPAVLFEWSRPGAISLRVSPLPFGERLEWRASLAGEEQGVVGVTSPQQQLGPDISLLAVANRTYVDPLSEECLWVVSDNLALSSQALQELLLEEGFSLPMPSLSQALTGGLRWLEDRPQPTCTLLSPVEAPPLYEPEVELGHWLHEHLGALDLAGLVSVLRLLERCCEKVSLLAGAAGLKYRGERLLRELVQEKTVSTEEWRQEVLTFVTKKIKKNFSPIA